MRFFFIQLIRNVVLSGCIMIPMVLNTLPSEAYHNGFIYLDEIDPSIKVILRYGTHENFIGNPLPGYHITNRAIMTLQAAQALEKVQKEVQKDGYCLVVYDAYRPQKAVDCFIQWSTDYNDQVKKSYYYPYVDKEKVFELGYLAKRSGHSRGSTVDITIIKNDHALHPIIASKHILNDGYDIPFLDDGTIDMGCSWDLFDIASHYHNDVTPVQYMPMREYLRKAMETHGFKGIQEEWWHFTLIDEPYPDTYFNFPVE